MTANSPRSGRHWTALLAWGLLLLVAGGAAATWGLARWQGAAQFLGVAPKPAPFTLRQAPPSLAISSDVDPATLSRIATLEGRLAAVEDRTRQNAGSVGRADALLVSFAARRAIERGVPLGYLETLLTQRFGSTSPRAVATIITASRQPVTLDQLLNEYRALEPTLRRGPPDESLWNAFRREMGSLIAVHRSNAPSPMVEARYDRALANLERGEVDRSLAETMRLPGAGQAQAWAAKARRYIAAQRALDEIEGAALLSSER
jgi:hypothetical protein